MFADALVAETDDGADDVEMDAEEVEALLRQQGWGCLTLARDDAAYSIPVSFGYDGDSTVYFQLRTDTDSQKLSYLDATATATFLVPHVRPPHWSSVVVRGEVGRVSPDETEEAYAAFTDNAWFPVDPWTEGDGPVEVAFYEIEADEMTGRSSPLSE